MSVTELKRAVKRLTPKQRAAFRKWFREYEADLWDQQIEEDAKAGRLDKLLEEAEREYRQGRTLEAPSARAKLPATRRRKAS